MAVIGAKDLAALSVPDDAERLAALPTPEKTGLAEASPGEQIAVAEHYLKQAVRMLRGELSVSEDAVELPCAECGEPISFGRGELWERILLTLVAYFDYAVRKVIKAGEMKPGWLTAAPRLQIIAQILEAEVT